MTIQHKITTVTLNPAIDETAFVPNFRAGEVNRVEFEQSDPGGKGVNVASFLSDFGYGVTVTGFLGADNTELFQHFFATKNIEDKFIRIPGKTRVNVKVIDSARYTTTDLNFPGAPVEDRNVEQLLRLLDALSSRSDLFVLSGSLPAGAPPSIYKQISESLKAAGKTVMLDASGESLNLALDALPDVIKPNITELRELTGAALSTESEVVEAGRELVSRGIETVIISMGAEGALFVSGSEVVKAHPPAIEVKSTVGAGDAMVAGWIVSQLRELPLEDAARLATAFSMGAVCQLGRRLPYRDVIESFVDRVTVRRI